MTTKSCVLENTKLIHLKTNIVQCSGKYVGNYGYIKDYEEQISSLLSKAFRKLRASAMIALRKLTVSLHRTHFSKFLFPSFIRSVAKMSSLRSFIVYLGCTHVWIV